MGPVNYGFVGVLQLLQVFLAVTEISLGNAVTKEVARLSANLQGDTVTKDTCWTFEVLAWIGGVSFLGIVILGAGPIAGTWFASTRIPLDTAILSIVLVGLSLAFQFPCTVIFGSLTGLQRFHSLNSATTLVGLMRPLGGLVCLTYLSNSVTTFLAWQCLVSVIQYVLSRMLLSLALPKSQYRGRFRLSTLVPLRFFIAGLTGTGVLGVVLVNTDRLLLSKLVTLNEFGVYVLAFQLSSVPGLVAAAFFQTAYPRFARLAGKACERKLAEEYHLHCQLLAALIIPIGLIIACFSRELVLLWTRNPALGDGISALVTVLVIGQVLMGLMSLPYSLQLAHSWVSLGFYANVISILLLIPSLVVLTRVYGSIGAGFAWVLLYGGQFLGIVSVLHKRVLPNEKWRWYWDDVIKPAGRGFLVIGLGRAMWVGGGSKLGTILYILLFMVAGILSAGLPCSQIRHLVSQNFRSRKL